MSKENEMLVINMLVISKDVKEMLHRQAKRAKLSISSYIEKIILENESEYKRELQTEKSSQCKVNHPSVLDHNRINDFISNVDEGVVKGSI